jgi:methanogenic corrinoid protein MtbC1
MAPKNNVEVLNNRHFLVHAMAKLDEKAVLDLVRKELEQGVDSFTLLKEARTGMLKVSERYSSGTYFLGDLIVASDIFQDVLNMVLASVKTARVDQTPPIIFGTVEEDIHDIGKNITIGFLKSKGFEVYDLGVNVPPQVFVDAVRQTGSSMLCLSGLITTAYDSMKKTIALLDREGLRHRVSVIIGGLVSEEVKNYTGADYWVIDCATGSELCESILRSGTAKRTLSL